jgi:hypothetical protein
VTEDQKGPRKNMSSCLMSCPDWDSRWNGSLTDATADGDKSWLCLLDLGEFPRAL